MPEEITVACDDCGRPYEDGGFQDLVIPNWAWRQISPARARGDLDPQVLNGGLLCPSCICKRLHDAGIRCEGAFMSGPIESVSYHLMRMIRGVENLREQGHGWSCPDCGACRDKCEHAVT